jgi:XTP/dITP diphosphohydrolase
MSSNRVLVVGSHNRKKVGELLQLLGPHGFTLRTLADFADSLEVVEDGDSFTANANLKASRQAVHLGHWVLGEDSGLCVPALGGAPGIYSARFAGPQATDELNNRLLLEKLSDLPDEQRAAYYVCHMSLSDPQGKIWIDCEGQCHGRIRREASGAGGFGYDPLFELVEYHRTFGELSATVKGVLSHRSRAVAAFVPQLLQLVSNGHWVG